jgi:hypothetical protein
MYGCSTCEQMTEAALRASSQYHDLLKALEAAHISHEMCSVVEDIKARLEAGLHQRNEAIEALCIHEHNHVAGGRYRSVGGHGDGPGAFSAT